MGLATLLLGVLLFWATPVWLHSLEEFPLDYWEVMLILFGFVSLSSGRVYCCFCTRGLDL